MDRADKLLAILPASRREVKARCLWQMQPSLKAVPATGLRGGAVNPSLGATDAIPGIGPPLSPVPGAFH